MPVMFAHFLCDLFGFCLRKFPAKKNTGTLFADQWLYVYNIFVVFGIDKGLV